MIGLYPLRNSSDPVQSPSDVSAFFSSASATVATVLPNVLLPTPTPTPPPYAFNISIPASAGALVASGLGTSTYSAVLNTRHPNATAIPTVTPSPSLVTFIITSNGEIVTSVSTAATPSVTLGQPAGYTVPNGVASLRTPPVTFSALLGVVPILILIVSNFC